MPPLMSKSYEAVRFFGVLPGVASVIHRSGWLYERTGLPCRVPTKAIRRASRETETSPIVPSMLATFAIGPPLAGTLYNSEWFGS
jgi:hypothetical protein